MGGDNILGWEVEIVRGQCEVLDSPALVELPGRDTHADYRVMERFCSDHFGGAAGEELAAAIRGRGAFGRFWDAVARRGLEPA